MKSLLISATLLLSVSALAAGGGGEHDVHHIPWEAIRNQAINIGILLAALIFMLRKSIPAAFQARQASFLEEAQKTEAALKLAEAELKDIKTRLAELEKTETASIAKAEKEAIVAGEKIVSDSQAQGKKIVDDTSLIINAEVLKAKSQIREKIISQSMAITEQGIKASADAITKKSESGFLQDLGQVKA
ncbi:ATP synthase F0 subunit B [Pseudobdellovibrio sp. HCB154]|uniref:ATP synthase F0 subunit B n=1 Tax=Pseudobdellovibrio sp. HCB154 TaxID=3386277 RepID=UPI003916E51A